MLVGNTIYKICSERDWERAVAANAYVGSADDMRDGFIHFSTAEQLAGTAARHFRGQPDLVLIAVDAPALGAALRWEPSRGGALFPHLYGPLSIAACQLVGSLPLDSDQIPVIPGNLAP